MRRNRLGSSIAQESYLDKKTGKRKTCATWTVRYDARSDGPRKQRKVGGFATYDDAALWWFEQKNNPQRDVPVAEVIKAAPPTLREFSNRWLKSIRNSVTDGALATYEKHVRCWIEPTLGDVLLVDLERRPELIEQAQADWLTRRRQDGRKGCVTPGYVKSVRNTMTTILNRAKRLRLIATNPTEFVDHVRVQRAEMRSLDPAAASRYMVVFDGTELGCAVAVAIGSGCRRGELLALRWCDVNLEGGTLRVARSLERVTIKSGKRARYELRFKEPKTRQSRRTISLPGFALERLRRHRLEQAERFLSAGAGRPGADTLVFENDGAPFNPNSFGMTFARIVADAGLPRVRLHDLRHSFASLMIASGTDLKTVSTALGHSTISVTADVYAHVSPAMLKGAASLLDGIVESGRKASGD